MSSELKTTKITREALQDWRVAKMAREQYGLMQVLPPKTSYSNRGAQWYLTMPIAAIYGCLATVA